MPVTRSVGCLGRDERRDRIAGREGLVQRLVLVVAFVLLAVLAVLGGFGRTVAVVLGREILAIAVVAHCGAPVLACPILEPVHARALVGNRGIEVFPGQVAPISAAVGRAHGRTPVT